MTAQQAQEKAEELRQTINQHNYQYYILDDPTIPDSEYDRLLGGLDHVGGYAASTDLAAVVVQPDAGFALGVFAAGDGAGGVVFERGLDAGDALDGGEDRVDLGQGHLVDGVVLVDVDRQRIHRHADLGRL